MPRTARPRHSAQARPPCTRLRAAGVPSSVCSWFYLYQAGPTRRDVSDNTSAAWLVTHRKNDMWAVSVSRDDLQAFDGLRVADDVVQLFWPVLLDPARISAKPSRVQRSHTMAARMAASTRSHWREPCPCLRTSWSMCEVVSRV